MKTSQVVRIQADLCDRIEQFIKEPDRKRNTSLQLSNGTITVSLPNSVLEEIWPVMKAKLIEVHNRLASEIGCQQIKD